MCGWQLHVLPPLRSAQLSPWDGRRAAGVDPLRAVLCCTTCGVRAGVWAFLPQGVTLDSPAGTVTPLVLYATVSMSISISMHRCKDLADCQMTSTCV